MGSTVPKEGAATSSVDPDRVILSQFAKSKIKSKIELIQSESEHACSFVIWEEDHTLGNALRHMIMKNPNVLFCGYSMPHPSEAKIHLRIQTSGSITAIEALKKGLNDLRSITLCIKEKFIKAGAKLKN